jgi:prolipoprotein diacylglyceryltransferase
VEFTLLFAALAGVFGLYGFLWWEGKRGNAADCSRSLWDTAVTAAIVGILGGRLAAMVLDGVNPITNPGDIIIVRAGVATGPATLVALATIVVLARRELVIVADGLAAAALGGLAGWHAGCLGRDACLGTPSDLPWASALEGSTITRHPVELYAAALFFLAAAGLAWFKAYRRPSPWLPTGVALVAAGSVRLATEPMRPALAGGPEAWYWAAVVLGAVLIALSRARRREALKRRLVSISARWRRAGPG